MNGLDVARALRQRVAREKAPRIIAVTGWGQEGDRQLTRAAELDFHLTKPVNRAELDVLLALEDSGQREKQCARPMRH
jgi:CheY-like chemotaxis protein